MPVWIGAVLDRAQKKLGESANPTAVICAIVEAHDDLILGFDAVGTPLESTAAASGGDDL